MTRQHIRPNHTSTGRRDDVEAARDALLDPNASDSEIEMAIAILDAHAESARPRRLPIDAAFEDGKPDPLDEAREWGDGILAIVLFAVVLVVVVTMAAAFVPGVLE